MPHRFTTAAIFTLTALQTACTFVTNSPDAPPCAAPNGGSNNAGGGSGNGGAQNNSGSGNTPMAGALSNEPWENATSNLAGKPSECGNLGFVTAKPGEDLLIVGIAKQGLWSSSDGGENWEQLGTGAGSADMAHRPAGIVFDRDEPKRFWEYGIYGPGVFLTEDAGDTFSQLGDASHTDLFSVDLSDPDRLTMLAGGHEQARTVNLSTDGGMTWENVGADLPDSTNCTLPLVLGPSLFFVGCGGYGGGKVGIYRSDDAGASWSEASPTGGGAAPLVTSDGRIFWTNTYPGGMSRSLDGGETWEDLGALSGLGVATSAVELPDGRIAVLSKETVLVSDDDGETFRSATAGVPYGDTNQWTYSQAQKAFYISHLTCSDPVPDDAVMRASFDYEAH